MEDDESSCQSVEMKERVAPNLLWNGTSFLYNQNLKRE